MALPPVSALPPPLRGAGFIPAFISPTVPQAPVDAFNRIVETARATDGPLPTRGLDQAVGQANLVSLLDRSLFRDLVSNFQGITGVTALPQDETALFTALGVDGLLGRSGLPTALQGLSERDAGVLTASLASIFSTIQAFGGANAAAPGIGSLLDVAA
jgi:hypothetical protein